MTKKIEIIIKYSNYSLKFKDGRKFTSVNYNAPKYGAGGPCDTKKEIQKAVSSAVKAILDKGDVPIVIDQRETQSKLKGGKMTIHQNKEIQLGLKRCPEWLKVAYRKAVEYICEECFEHESKVGTLRPHRLKRGCDGGTYIPRNVKMVCASCHKVYHYKEGPKK